MIKNILLFLFGIVFLFFMGMLYWSSLLLEEDVKEVLSSVQNLRKEISSFKINVQETKNSSTRIDSSLPNLLKEDLFYKETLPKLLPPHFKPTGTRHVDVMGRPDTLHPFINLAPFSTLIDQCQLTLATQDFGKYETMAPYFARRIEEKIGDKGIEYWVYLRDDVYWQPLNPDHFPSHFTLDPIFFQPHQVTAHDVKFYADAMLNPFVQEAGAVALRNYYSDLEAIKVIDDFTLVVRWKADALTNKVKYASKSLTGQLKPLARFVYQYFPDGKKIVEDETEETYKNDSVWAQQFSHHWARQIIVSCGPWIFDGMTDKLIRFERNPNHFNPLEVLVEAMEVQFKESSEAVWLDFKTIHTDTYVMGAGKELDLKNFIESSEYAKQKNQSQEVFQLQYLDRSYQYIGWNQATPYFNDKVVRKAMTMAIDIQHLINQNLNGMGVPTTGTFALDSPAYDPTIPSLPYDPLEAKRLLQNEGWYDSDGDGIIDKTIDGEKIPFSFSLAYYVKNPTTKINCEFIANSLKEIGVNCQLKGMDIADIMHAFENKEFDAIYFGWALGVPPEEPRQLWYSTGAKEKGSSNAIGFANSQIDQIIDQLIYEYDPQKRVSLYHEFDKIIYEEQPYTFLYVPKNNLLYRSYVKNVFIPSERQDLIPGADIAQPDLNIIWLQK